MKTEKQIFEDLQNAANIAEQNKRQLIIDCCSKVMSEVLNHKTDLLVHLLWNTEIKDLKRIFKQN